MSTPANVQRAANEARARGMTYALLAWGWRYPEAETVATCGALLTGCTAADVSDCLDLNTRAALMSAMPSIANDFSASADWEASYCELFGHAVRGSCPLYELEYGQSEIVQQASELADIAGFYSAFGLENTRESLERVDHISVECEFMSVLCAKQAAGALSHNTNLADTCVDAQRIFLRDHLARWLPALCSRVANIAGDGPFGHLARELRQRF